MSALHTPIKNMAIANLIKHKLKALKV